MTAKQTQNLLQYLGYYSGPVDGILGSQSIAAIRGFQAFYGLTVDGIAGEQTQKTLIEAVAGTAAHAEKTETAPSKPEEGAWWEDIRYFKRSEFACKCGRCGGFPAEPQEAMVRIADKIRAKIGKPITVNSGLRCKTHNANVGGVSNSQHLYGKAADLGCPSGCTPAQMASIAEEIMGDTGGIGIYAWGIHIDTRSAKSRWSG